MELKKDNTLPRLTDLQIVNGKAIRKFRYHIAEDQHLVLIGGDCDSGKTSSCDMLVAALKGAKYEPPEVIHHEADTAQVVATFSNGLQIEKVWYDDGQKSKLIMTDTKNDTPLSASQNLLDKFFSLAIDTRIFEGYDDTKKMEMILTDLGIDLTAIDKKIATTYEQRKLANAEHQRQKSALSLLTYDPKAPAEPIGMKQIMEEMNRRNGLKEERNKQLETIQEFGANIQKVDASLVTNRATLTELQAQVAALTAKIETQENWLNHNRAKHVEQFQTFEQLPPLPANEDLIKQQENIDTVNAQVTANREYKKIEKLQDDAFQKWNELNEQVETLRKERMKALEAINGVHPELTVDENSLLFKGQPWSGMSTSEQKTITALICAHLNKNSNLLLMDGLEALDTKKRQELFDFCKERNLYILATVVGKDNATLIMENGEVVGDEWEPEPVVIRGRKPKTEVVVEETTEEVDSETIDEVPDMDIDTDLWTVIPDDTEPVRNVELKCSQCGRHVTAEEHRTCEGKCAFCIMSSTDM